MNNALPRLRAIVHTDTPVRHSGELVRLPPGRGIMRDFYAKGWPFLWEHGSERRGDKPIGRAVRLWLRSELIVAELEFNQGDEFAMKLFSHFRDGALSDFSIAWSAKLGDLADGVRIADEWSLAEISAVNKGQNPACRVLRLPGETSGFSFRDEELKAARRSCLAS